MDGQSIAGRLQSLGAQRPLAAYHAEAHQSAQEVISVASGGGDRKM